MKKVSMSKNMNEYGYRPNQEVLIPPSVLFSTATLLEMVVNDGLENKYQLVPNEDGKGFSYYPVTLISNTGKWAQDIIAGIVAVHISEVKAGKAKSDVAVYSDEMTGKELEEKLSTFVFPKDYNIAIDGVLFSNILDILDVIIVEGTVQTFSESIKLDVKNVAKAKRYTLLAKNTLTLRKEYSKLHKKNVKDGVATHISVLQEEYIAAQQLRNDGGLQGMEDKEKASDTSIVEHSDFSGEDLNEDSDV